MWPFRPSRGTAAVPDPSGPRTGLPAAQRDRIGRNGIGRGAAGLVLEPTLPPLLLPAAPELLDPRRLETQVLPSVSNAHRIAMGMRCRDAEPMPRVPDAGRVGRMADGRRVQVMHNGIRVLADGYCGAWMTELIERCHGHHEPQEERLFHELLRCLPPGGTMLELGGYWAFYSIWFLLAAPGRRAVLLEPDPRHIEVGRANLALNGVAAEIVQGFLGDRPGETLPFPTEESGTLDLACHDVAGLMAARGLDRLTILHCDAQGAEFTMLEQAAPLLRDGRVDWLFLSTHHHLISGDPLTHQRCVEAVRALGGVIEVEHDVGEGFSGDGLILARFGAAPPGWRCPAISYNRASESLFRHPLYDLAASRGQGMP